MKVVEFARYGDPDVLTLAERPEPEATSGSVRIRIRAAAVNPADTKFRAGMYAAYSTIPLPHVVGYDVAGEIDQVGEGVIGLSIGDRVFARLDAATKGGYAQYVVLPAGDAALMPAELDFATAAAIPTAGLTGTQMVEISADLQLGAVVLITGAVGAVGRFAVFAARRRSAKVIAAVRQSQVDEARGHGVDDVIVVGSEDWQGPAFDVVLDTVGGADVGRLCRYLAPNGRIFTAATTPIEGAPAEPVFVMVQSDPAKLVELAHAVANQAVAVPVARILPFTQAAQAHRLVEAGGAGGKIVLEP